MDGLGKRAVNDHVGSMIDPTLSEPMPRKRTAIWRGFKGECPKCGQARLFRAYLKPVDACASCGHEWVEVRADDGPAWATMLVVGHVLAASFHLFIFRWDLSVAQAITGLCTITLIASLILLPRMKGLWMGWIWRTGSLMS